MIDPKDMTIIIPHLGATKEQQYALSQCLPSLLETSKSKIIVASNASQIPLFFPSEALKNKEQVDWIHLWGQGQCKAVNAAVAIVNTPWIFVTNDDMVYAPRWFERLVGNQYGINSVDDQRRVFQPLCISPKLIEPRKGAPTFIEYFCGGAGGDFDKQKWLEFAENYKIPEGTGDGFKTGFNLPFLIKKELWDTIGGYDINFDPWGSNGDSDLEYKIRLAGVQPYQNTNCIVYHFSQTSGTFHPDNQSYWQKNWDYFIEKWGFPRTDEGIWEANFKMPDKERVFRPDWEAKYGSVY